MSAHANGGFVGRKTDTSDFLPGKGKTGEENSYSPLNPEGPSTSASVQVSVNVSPTFDITSNDVQDEESILKVIRKHLREMADELGGEIADKLGEVFTNVPIR